MKIKKSSPLAKIKRGLATRLRGGQDESDDCNNESKTPRAGVSKRRKKKYPAKKNPLSSEFKRETHQTLTISLEGNNRKIFSPKDNMGNKKRNFRNKVQRIANQRGKNNLSNIETIELTSDSDNEVGEQSDNHITHDLSVISLNDSIAEVTDKTPEVTPKSSNAAGSSNNNNASTSNGILLNRPKDRPLFFVDTKPSMKNNNIPKYLHISINPQMRPEPISKPTNPVEFISTHSPCDSDKANINPDESPVDPIITLDDSEVCILESDNEMVIPVPKVNLDDSVVFVSETRLPNKKKTPKGKDHNVNIRSIKIGRKTRLKNYKGKVNASIKSLLGRRGINLPLQFDFTNTLRVENASKNKKRKKQIFNDFSNNLYNPNGPVRKTEKRFILLDGGNIAFSHSRNKEFSVKGLSIAIEFFEKMGHEIRAIVPQMRLKSGMSTDPRLLESLHADNKVMFTPCKSLPGRNAISYDDRILMQMANELDAAIISNDNYRDLIDESPDWKRIIETRVVGFCWCDDTFVLPKDPYGLNGPVLDEILYRKVSDNENNNKPCTNAGSSKKS